jgi:hypothetical protein
VMLEMGRRVGLFETMGEDGRGDEHRDRRQGRTQRALRPRVAWRDGLRRHRRVLGGRAHVQASARARFGPHGLVDP